MNAGVCETRPDELATFLDRRLRERHRKRRIVERTRMVAEHPLQKMGFRPEEHVPDPLLLLNPAAEHLLQRKFPRNLRDILKLVKCDHKRHSQFFGQPFRKIKNLAKRRFRQNLPMPTVRDGLQLASKFTIRCANSCLPPTIA